MRFVSGLSVRFFALVLLLLVISPLFFMGGPDYLSSPLHKAVWDLGHFGFFALLLVMVQVRWPLPRWTHWLWVALVVFIAGGAIEVVQSFIGRDATWADVWNNLLGASLGLFWGQRADARIWVGRVLATTMLLLPAWSVAKIAWVQYESVRTFPLLADFESPRELLRWDGDMAMTQDRVASGKHAIKVRLSTAKYSGVSFNWFLGDWTGYQQLAFDLYNPDPEPLSMVLRIHDEMHDRNGGDYADRFNHRLLAQPGWNHFVISLDEVRQAPAAREMDLQQLRALGLFVVQLPRSREIYLDNLRLQ